MTMKGKLFGSNQIGPGNCGDCRQQKDVEDQPDDYWCDNCQSTSSEYFTHFGATADYLVEISYIDIRRDGEDRFLVPENRDAIGIEWNREAAKRLLAEAEIPEEKMEETVFHALAIVRRKENELITEPQIRAMAASEARAMELVKDFEEMVVAAIEGGYADEGLVLSALNGDFDT